MLWVSSVEDRSWSDMLICDKFHELFKWWNIWVQQNIKYQPMSPPMQLHVWQNLYQARVLLSVLKFLPFFHCGSSALIQTVNLGIKSLVSDHCKTLRYSQSNLNLKLTMVQISIGSYLCNSHKTLHNFLSMKNTWVPLSDWLSSIIISMSFY